MRITLAIAALLLAACNEIPQDAPKPYAGKEDTKAYDEKTLAERANHQNEYLRTGDAKQ